MSARVEAAGVFCAALAYGAPAWASEPSPIRLGYQADAPCPTAADLSDQIQARTAEVRMAQDGETAWEFEVAIDVAPERAEAHLVVRDPSGRVSSRHLAGRDCEEVVEALGLILALTVDARARTDPVSELSPPVPADVERASEPPDAEPVAGTEVTAEPGARWTFGGGVEGLLLLGIAPTALPAVGGFLETTRVGPGFLLPALRVSLRRAQAGGFDAEGGTAAFRLMAGAIEACPLWVGFHESLGVRPCGYCQWGTLRAAGSNTTDPQTVEKMWLSLGPALRLEYVPASGLVLDARFALDVPLRRGRFIFVPDVFHEMDAVGAALGFGVAGRFP